MTVGFLPAGSDPIVISMAISNDNFLEEVMLSRDDLCVIRDELNKAISEIEKSLPQDNFGGGVVKIYARAMGVEESHYAHEAIEILKNLRNQIVAILEKDEAANSEKE